MRRRIGWGGGDREESPGDDRGGGAFAGADYKQIDNVLMISWRKLFHFQFHFGRNLWFSISLTHSRGALHIRGGAGALDVCGEVEKEEDHKQRNVKRRLGSGM